MNETRIVGSDPFYGTVPECSHRFAQSRVLDPYSERFGGSRVRIQCHDCGRWWVGWTTSSHRVRDLSAPVQTGVIPDWKPRRDPSFSVPEGDLATILKELLRADE